MNLDIIPSNLTKDNHFMGLAFYVSTLSKDPASKIGAVIKTDDNHCYCGYNGCPMGFNDELLKTELKHDVVLHAEHNALNFAGLERCRSQKNLTLYVTIRPCPRCALLLVHFNVKRVVYYSDYKSVVNDIELLEKIRNRGGLSGEPAFTLEKYTGELLFSHNHMGIK